MANNYSPVLLSEGECSGSFTDSVDSCECDMLRTSPKKVRQQQVGPVIKQHDGK